MVKTLPSPHTHALPRKTKRTTLLLASILFLTPLFATACGDEEASEADAAATDKDCVSNTQYFLKEVWTPVVEKQCYVCHNPQGAARNTKMVFQPPGQVGFLEHNMEVFRDVSTYEKDGYPLILAKPSLQVDHGGAQIFDKDSESYAKFTEMIQRLGQPDSCSSSIPVDDFFSDVNLLSPKQTLRKASLSLAGRLPTEQEYALIEEGGTQGLEAALDRIMLEDPFYARLEEIFNDLLLTNKYLGRNRAVDLLDSDFFPDGRWHLADNASDGIDPAFFEAASTHSNDSLAQEPLKLISYIVRNDLPFTEVLTADYIAVNPFTAKLYGLDDIAFEDPTNPDEYKPGRVAGTPHAGLLTSPMFLNRFPTTDTNRNRHRSRTVYELFLATNVLKLAERPIDPTSVVHNPTMNDPQCTVCHTVIDPLAGAFQNWDDQGSYSPPDAWHGDMLEPGFGKEAITGDERMESLPWLTKRIAQDPRFDISTVYTIFRALIGHEPLSLPRSDDNESYDTKLEAYNVQQELLYAIAREFRANNHNLKTVFRSLILSPYYRASNIQQDIDDVRKLQVAGLGPQRLLTPEMLHRKILAVTGLPWRSRPDRPNYLLSEDEYLVLYGGIDSDDVTERITEPNGIMANIQQRMANELSCRDAARDFANEKDTRTFFPFVEPSFTPLDENGFEVQQSISAIKENIVHLHWHILGEEVTENGPEVERVYSLFFDLWKEGYDKVQEEELSTSLSWNCRHRRDFWTQRDLPSEDRLERDDAYTIRAWTGVLTYFFSDYTFLYE